MSDVFRVLTRFGGCDFHYTRTVSHTFFRSMEKELKSIIQECLSGARHTSDTFQAVGGAWYASVGVR